MQRVIARPATIEVDDDAGGTRVICMSALMSDEHEWANSAVLEGLVGCRIVDLGRVDQDLPGLVSGVTAPNGYGITIRTTVPGDTIGDPAFPQMPLPVPVIEAILAGENMDTHIEALTEDDGFVATLLLVTDVGMWVRFSAQWVKLASIDQIEGMNSVEVHENSVSLYDAADQAGKQLPLSALPGKDDEPLMSSLGELYVAGNVSRTFRTPEELQAVEALTAAMESLPEINTRDQLLAAAKECTPSQQWYFKKRATALGVDESELEWQG